jgi:hypothetical protein
MGAKASVIHPPDQGVCGRHGTEDHDMTQGLSVLGGTEGDLYLAKWEARRTVDHRRLKGRKSRPAIGSRMGWAAVGKGGWNGGTTRQARATADSSMRERPRSDRPRTGDCQSTGKKVHQQWQSHQRKNGAGWTGPRSGAVGDGRERDSRRCSASARSAQPERLDLQPMPVHSDSKRQLGACCPAFRRSRSRVPLRY